MRRYRQRLWCLHTPEIFARDVMIIKTEGLPDWFNLNFFFYPRHFREACISAALERLFPSPVRAANRTC
jgi:hypothetical protein